MAREVIEVVARFGDALLDVAHIGSGGTYWIGAAPGVDLVVPGLECFPLVDNLSVRIPVGMHVIEHASSTELRAGALTLLVSRAYLAHDTVFPPRVDWRLAVFVLAALAAHVAILLVAMACAPLERCATPRAQPRLVRIATTVAPPMVDPPRPAPPRPAPPTPVVANQPARAARIAIAVAAAESKIAERVADDDTEKPNFGDARRFDPGAHDDWGTIKTAGFATTPYDVELCPASSCKVTGPIPPLYVRTHLYKYMAEIYGCYRQFAVGPGTIVLEFTITADGAVRDARGTGLDGTGECAARIAGEIMFKALGRETLVRYPLVFR